MMLKKTGLKCPMCVNENSKLLVELKQNRMDRYGTYILYQCLDCGMRFKYYGEGFYAFENKKHVKIFEETACEKMVEKIWTEKEFTLEGWDDDDEICQVYRNGNCMGTDEVVDTLNEFKEENEKLKLKLHIWEQVAYMLDIEVNRAMEEGFEISEWYKNHLAKGPVIL